MPPAPALHHCAECGKPFPDDELVGYLTAFICAGCKDRFFQKLREGAKLPGLVEYGGFWIRVGAKLLDHVIIMFIILIFVLILGGIIAAVGFGTGSFQKINPNDPGFIFLVFGAELLYIALIFGVQAVYNVWFVLKYGATPGKLALGLKLVTPDGKPLTWQRALARFGAEIFITGMTCNIGYLIAAFDDERRTLHDHICNTRVVKK